ncbi:hypothetical protein ESY86_08315 [Subsaximicrobium wynnwilliamsii]|uniref:Uncharacterized protein n=1 Tax=Subsaximicrobium wynnwilliamsii TaxID=291179 RepID=A0A5C6ZHC1_9FLAO|nr:hypothetical protein [Subsaximicrobium wynnwilliamsii]TXD83733.1 hypothetical protein ESY87_08890 [Subsaximicrobium wynnwilliamsii]TXD89383.1 hypothetical protein ESY86_08315 [Subsaximicrobium wynnwilliamsii]TXE03570.1 hypothetical protein ESY88_07915 [Subsaximicrobium wynnwilliamsii]
MKILFCFLVIFASAKECNQKKAEASAETKSEVLKTEAFQKDLTMTYEANTRGFYEKIWVEGDSVKFTNDRYGKVVVSNILPKNEKTTLVNLLNAVDLKTMPQLEAPSKAHQYDGAAMATLNITSEKSSYETKTFDHGNPPEAIKALVEKLLALKAKMVEE